MRPIADLRATIDRATYLPALQAFAHSLLDQIETVRRATLDEALVVIERVAKLNYAEYESRFREPYWLGRAEASDEATAVLIALRDNPSSP